MILSKLQEFFEILSMDGSNNNYLPMNRITKKSTHESPHLTKGTELAANELRLDA